MSFIPIQVDVRIKSIKIKNLHLGADPAAIERIETSLTNLESLMAQTKEEFAAALEQHNTDLDAATTSLNKAMGEIVEQVQELTAAVAEAGNSTPRMDAALAALSTKSSGLKAIGEAFDALNEDAPEVPPETPAGG